MEVATEWEISHLAQLSWKFYMRGTNQAASKAQTWKLLTTEVSFSSAGLSNSAPTEAFLSAA